MKTATWYHIISGELVYVSPPDIRPHGFYYLRGIRGCAVGVSFNQALNRYKTTHFLA